MLSDIPGGLGGPTQYSILNTLPLDPNPRTLTMIITVVFFVNSEKYFFGCEVTEVTGLRRAPPFCHLILNTEGCKVAKVTMTSLILKTYFFKFAGL